MAKISHMALPVSDVRKAREWYVDTLGFNLEREREGAVGVKDQSGLTIFLIQNSASLAGQKITLTIQVDNVESKHKELSALGVAFVSPPQFQYWGYGAEVLDPDGYLNHLWDEVSMARAMSEARDKR